MLLLLASLRRNLCGLGRRVHGRFIRAHIPEQDGAIRQVLLHQAGAGGGHRAGNDRVDRTHIRRPNPVAAPVVVAVVVVPAVVPEAAVNMPVVAVVVMMPVVVMPVVVVMTVAVDMTHHVTMMTMTAAAVTAAAAMTAAAVTAGVSTGRDKRCHGDDRRSNQSKECSTFEHCERPSLARGEPSEGFVGEAGQRVQAIDFRFIFVHLTFIDGATVWQAPVVCSGLQLVPHQREIG